MKDLKELIRHASVRINACQIDKICSGEMIRADLEFRCIPYFLISFFGEDNLTMDYLKRETCADLPEGIEFKVLDSILAMTPDYEPSMSDPIFERSYYVDGIKMVDILLCDVELKR